ncbi:MAG: prolyl oligopeptidase family serine peptidase [Bacteroides sp.]|nr:prolyl oligopeptidase family serine peptidase [Bacteroides sp.]MCM1413094.1 prolyl oligopeptidase family serine peptidase [Bacteroides sp.]MCM1472164.1 prolyl oligopeptidase family serine peptidase [Bacteroides sp.]
MSASTFAANPIQYPVAPSDPSVSDNYFGTVVPDIYRPLENDTAAATTAWVKAENAITNDYLARIPFRENIRARLTELLNYKKTGLPWRDNDGKYYFFENDGLQNQSVLYRSSTLDGTPEVFIDPNKLSTDGTVALTGVFQSPDGKYTAYTISRNGSDWTEIYLLDTRSGKLLGDHIEWAKFTNPQWWKDGFFYSAYPRPEQGKEFSNANENHQIYYHKVGTPQSQDQLVYEDPAHPLHFHSPYVPEGEDYLFVLGSGEGFGESIMMKKLGDDAAEWIVIEPSQDFEISPVGIANGKVYFLTLCDAPNYRLVAADLTDPRRENWQTIIPETANVISDVTMSGDKLIIKYMIDAADHLYVHDLDGNRLNEIQLPTYGTASVWGSKKYPDDLFYTFTSFTSPAARYKYNATAKTSELIGRTELKGVNFDDYVTEQVFYTSADGTKIPMFITYKKGTKLDGSNPTLLYGYGGFNISLTPGFSAQRMLWLENGGIYAQPNLRGGGEYGETWHKAGTQQQKLNVFNDFIAAAQYLIDNGYTSADKLAIQGGSNGGLLVGATVNLRPDLFRVAIPQVGVMDMMRYHLFTIGWNWAPDYGTSADSKAMADYLLGYSPLHTIKNDGTTYPSILVTTADHDDRVVPAHSFKYAAQLQASDTGNNPKLIRIDSNAGHGAGKPTSKIIAEQTDIYSFIFNNLGITPDIK